MEILMVSRTMYDAGGHVNANRQCCNKKE